MIDVQKLTDEKTTLDQALSNLMDFAKTPEYMLVELKQRCLLAEQAHHMSEYSRVLGLRIAAVGA
jgi:hypothetical protein